MHDLTEVLHIWDERREMQKMIDHGLTYWSHTPADLDYFFHNDTNTGTYFEFAPDDTQGVSMVKARFDADALVNKTTPEVYMGYLHLYQNTEDGLVSPPAKTRKITVIFQPSIWTQQPGAAHIAQGTAAWISGEQAIHTSLHTKENFTAQASLTYHLPASSGDFVIPDWGMLINTHWGDHPQYSTELEQIFYDDFNYSQAQDYVIHPLTTSSFEEFEGRINLVYKDRKSVV